MLNKTIRNSLLTLLLAFTASVSMSACSSNEETSSNDSDVSCDPGDTREECADDIL